MLSCHQVCGWRRISREATSCVCFAFELGETRSSFHPPAVMIPQATTKPFPVRVAGQGQGKAVRGNARAGGQGAPTEALAWVWGVPMKRGRSRCVRLSCGWPAATTTLPLFSPVRL